MTIYRYHNSPLIDCIEVTTLRPGIAQATIIAKENATAQSLQKLREELGAQNVSTLMDKSDGKPAIQLRGIKNEKTLLKALTKAGINSQGITKETTVGEHKEVGFREKVRGKSLFLSAIFYDLGNIAFIVSGLQRGKHNPNGKMSSEDVSEMLIGASFSVGDVVMTFMGGEKGDEELNLAAQGLKKHLHQKGITLPDGNTLNPDTLHQSGALKATDRWLRKHIVHIKCLSETAGGLFTIHSALKRDMHGQVNQGKVAAGLIISTGWMSTFLLDKPNSYRIFGDNEPLQGAILPDSVTQMLPEPLRDNPRGWIARPAGMANNVANFWGSLNPRDGERVRFKNEALEAQQKFARNGSSANRAEMMRMQAKQKDYVWNVLSAGSFLVAHSLFGLSGSKRKNEKTGDFEVERGVLGETSSLRPNETPDDRAMMNDLVLMSANMLAKQPKNIRTAAIGETAEYVSKLAHVELNEEEVKKALESKIDELSHSNWASRTATSKSATQQVGV